MKKLSIICGLMLLILAFTATATFDVTYNFGDANGEVTVEAYVCNDAACEDATPLADRYGQANAYPEGQTTTDGSLRVVFPNVMISQHGYALFAFSEGRLPMEARRYYNQPPEYQSEQYYSEVTENVDFIQKDTCSSTVQNFNVINEVYANEPLYIDINAVLSGETASAFRITDNDVGFIPDEYKDEYYSVDTEVTVSIVGQQNQGTYTLTEQFTTANGNPLFADTVRPVTMTWTPTMDGTYDVSLTTHVIDNQCAATPTWDASTTHSLRVFEERLQNEAYTLMGSANTDTAFPTQGEPVTISFKKVSNYADAEYQHNALPTSVSYNIRKTDGSGTPIADTANYGANADPMTDVYNSETRTLQFTPQEAGMYTITMTGIATGAPNGVPNHAYTLVHNVYVNPEASHDLVFYVTDSMGGAYIEGATVYVYNMATEQTLEQTTDANGYTRFDDLSSGDYRWQVSMESYNSDIGLIQMTNASIYILNVPLTREEFGNTAPQISDIPNINMVAGTTNSEIDLDDYAFDAEDGDAALTWTATGNSQINVEIGSNHVVTFTAPEGIEDGYSETITFTVTDYNGGSDQLSATDTMIVFVSTTNTAPEFTGDLPDQELAEDTELNNIMYLPSFAQDNEIDSAFMTYTYSDNDCGVEIDASRRIDIRPDQDFNGECEITITVSDGEFTADTNFTVIVTPVQDAPRFTSTPVTEALQDEEYTYDANAVDVDGETLTYSLAGITQGDMEIDPETGVVTWTPGTTGDFDVTIQVTDGIDTVTQSYTITVTGESTEEAPVAMIEVSSIEDLTVIFVDRSYDPDGGYIQSWAWDFGDGNTATSRNPTHIYDVNGTYTVTLTVTDNDGLTDSTTAEVSVNEAAENIPPTAVIEANATSGQAPLGIEFDGSESTDDDGTIVSYLWDFGTNGGETSNAVDPTFTYTEDGNYTVTLTVTDNEGATDEATLDISVSENIPPTAVIIANVTSGQAPLTVRFDGTNSTDADGTIAEYLWNFGTTDIANSNADIPQAVTYTDVGIYEVTLMVTDNLGATDTARMNITVVDENATSPNITITVDGGNETSGLVPYTAEFASSIEDDGTIESYTWNFGNGQTLNGSGMPDHPTNEYTIPGVYIANLTVTDNDGLTATSNNVVVTVNTITAPIVTISASAVSGEAPLNVTFTSSVTDDGNVTGYAWNFGDGESSTEANVSHVYDTPGTYTATLTVTDNDGETGIASVLIRVSQPTEEKDDYRWTTSSLYIPRMNTQSGEVIRAGDQLTIGIDFENVRDLNLDNVKVSVSIPDLGVWRSAGPFKLKSGKDIHEAISVDIPEDAEPGEYDYRVALTDDDVRRVKVRQFTVE